MPRVPVARAVPVPSDLASELLDLLGSPNVGSRAWVFRQYDQIVRGGTVVRPGSDAAVVRVPCEVAPSAASPGAAAPRTLDKYLAFAVDCPARMCELDPFVGGAMAIAEVCRNLVCSGAEPVGITDCLNFGNPERPEVMDSFARAIDGIAAACAALQVPIVSGNVSLYNETSVRGAVPGESLSRAILPTPAVAAVGLLSGPKDIVTAAFKGAGDVVFLLGDGAWSGGRGLSGSEWLVRKTGTLATLAGDAPSLELEAEVALQRLVLRLARAHLLRSAHDVSDGGLAVALAECCDAPAEPPAAIRCGATVELPAQKTSHDALAALFGEAPSRVVVSVAAEAATHVLAIASSAGVPAYAIGSTGGTSLSIRVSPLPEFTTTLSEISRRRALCLEGIVGSSD